MTANLARISLESSDPQGDEATYLLCQMKAEALRRYGDVLGSSDAPATNDPLEPRSEFLIARLDSTAVGCAALRQLDAETAEVRRMYVGPLARRRGIGRRLLEELERKAIEFGYHTLRVETGGRQPEAIALYESYGFQRIAPYGCHVDDPLSVCFEMRLR